MAQILDGKAQAALLKKRVQERITAIGAKPAMAVVQVGNDPASSIYIRQKEKACAEVGMGFRRVNLPGDITQTALLAEIDALNADADLHGFLVQQPLPAHLDTDAVVERIAPAKDVDCLHPHNVGLVADGRGRLLPCTPAGILELLDAYDIALRGKHCVVVGASRIVGRPLALMLLAREATVTVCHIATVDLAAHCRQADVLLVAVGKPNLIRPDMLKPGCVIVDVGINRLADQKICGDVDFDGCAEKASYLTPVPGGVGPMTVAMLVANGLAAWELAHV